MELVEQFTEFSCSFVRSDGSTFVETRESTDMIYKVQQDKLMMELHLADDSDPDTFAFTL